eukprot:g9389.t1
MKQQSCYILVHICRSEIQSRKTCVSPTYSSTASDLLSYSLVHRISSYGVKSRKTKDSLKGARWVELRQCAFSSLADV